MLRIRVLIYEFEENTVQPTSIKNMLLQHYNNNNCLKLSSILFVFKVSQLFSKLFLRLVCLIQGSHCEALFFFRNTDKDFSPSPAGDLASALLCLHQAESEGATTFLLLFYSKEYLAVNIFIRIVLTLVGTIKMVSRINVIKQ